MSVNVNHSDPISYDTEELVFALVGPVGVNMTLVQEKLSKSLQDVGYDVHVIHITEVLKKFPKFEESSKKHKVGKSKSEFEVKIESLNEVCRKCEDNSVFAALTISEIFDFRAFSPKKKIAYIVRQLKRIEEIDLLTKVYGKRLVQVSITLEEEDRIENITRKILKEGLITSEHKARIAANEIVYTDENEDDESGQKVGSIFHRGDVFVNCDSEDRAERNISRFIKAFFGSNVISPTMDEFGSYMAVAASMRSCDLSRQTGAAILNQEGSIISLGFNETPKAFGGHYWEGDDFKQRDIDKKFEGNKDSIHQMLNDCCNKLSDAINEMDKENVYKILSKSLIGDITEYGRMTHAEMSAICDASKWGKSLQNSTMYATTFPCHNCAKHIVASGIKKLVYIEPYPKSKALTLHHDSISIDRTSSKKVPFVHFDGISPKRYRDIFQKNGKRRDSKGDINEWFSNVGPLPRIEGYTLRDNRTESMVIKKIFGKLKQFLS